MKSVNSILPTIEADDVWFFLKSVFENKSLHEENCRKKLERLFPSSAVFFFKNGRTALNFLMKNIPSPTNSVYLQAFTCSAVAYPIICNNRELVYVDIDPDSFNMSYNDLQKKQTKKAGAILIQYTFGLKPNKLDDILQFSRKHNLLIIEDVAHSLGSSHGGKRLGLLGDATILSFGRDKVVSSVSGGALLIHSQALANQLSGHYQQIPTPPLIHQIKQLFYLFFMFGARRFYHLKPTRALIYLLQRIKILDKAVSDSEKKGINKNSPPHKLSPLFFPLLYHQLNKLNSFSKTRSSITNQYNLQFKTKYNGALLKYPCLIDDRDEIIKKKRKKHIYLDSWYSNIIDPKGVDLKNYQYVYGSCPVAETVAKKIINLPTLWKLPEL